MTGGAATRLPVLYSFRRCPYAMRARLALVACGKRVELREVVLRSKPAAMLAASPKGTVPVLVLPDGGVLDESVAIMRWALDAETAAGWPAGDEAALIATNDGAFKHHLDRYKYADRHGTDRLEHRAAAVALLQPIERWLQGRCLPDSDHPSPTDMALLPFVRQFAETDRPWFDTVGVPVLHAWLARHLRSALLARIMVRATPWRPGDAPVAFPSGWAASTA